MAQNIYIRPLAKNYHDFTEKKIEETNEQTPFKFKSQRSEQYVKKPLRQPPPAISPVVLQQPKTQQQGFCSFLSSCCDRTSSPVENGEPQTDCCGSRNKHKSCHGSCSCNCLQPELCEECIAKICRQCRERMCLKFTLCEECVLKMCSKCRNLIYGNCCKSRPQLRSYPIRFKNKSNLHFMDCKCRECQKFNQGNQESASLPPNVNNQLNTEAKDSHFQNLNREFGQVDSVVHY